MALSEYSKYGNAAAELASAVKENRVAHAYLIEGDNNVNKMGFAKEFAKALLCREKPGEGCDHCATCRKIDDDNYEDIYMIEPVWNDKKTKCSIKTAAVKELLSDLKARPTGGDRNIAIINGGENMVIEAQNKFLKTLEEPNPGTVIMILSENRDNLLPTINSRCITYRLIDFEGSDKNEMVAFAGEIAEMIGNRDFFYDIVKKLDSKIGDSREAEAFLDGLENVFGDMLINGSDTFGRERISNGVSYIEDSRRELRGNVIYKYSIRNLILKLEEI
ncbi:hypothetical protein [Aminicella lysinilytica]|uniref:DNA polymerase III delta subunit-like protein n=1 Tax=Aminicella lysinilytica TaxID=433323 RepID=A0A4R6PXD1_9FIRM|nr:hypothetical protein [Aminicella lysinilytica]TDP50376.1 DNA polymerase III delta subunit-like protein [Aminicella lysinilytica]